MKERKCKEKCSGGIILIFWNGYFEDSFQCKESSKAILQNKRVRDQWPKKLYASPNLHTWKNREKNLWDNLAEFLKT